MEALDNNILGTNKIPGSEKFTRPEEIKALSKYLGNIRKTQDDHTKLGEESLALYGRKTGKLVDIKKLEDHQFLDTISDDSQFELVKGARPILENEGEDVVDLLQKRIELVESDNEGSNIKRLDSNVEKLDAHLDIEKLPIQSVELSPNEAPEDWTKKLLKDVVKLQGNKDITDLPTDSVNLDTPNRTIPLSDKKEELDVDNKVQSLTPHQKLEGINDDRTTSLSTVRKNLVDDRDIKLDSTIDSLNVRENIELETGKEKIKDDRFIELENKKEELEVKEDILLSDYIDSIEVSSIDNLPDTRVGLEDTNVIDSLPNSAEKLNVEDNTTLSDHIETIEDKRDLSLSDYRERIDITDVDSLSDKKIDISDEREVELSKEKLSIDDDKEVKKLPSDSVDILSNYGLEVSKLSDKKEGLKDSTTKSPEELSGERLDISDEREVELGKKKISPDGDIKEPELSEEQIQIQEGKNRQPDSLDEKRVKLVVNDPIEELSEFREDLNLENEPEINELSQFIESLGVDNSPSLDIHKEKLEVEEKVDRLEDGIYIIDNDTRPPLDELPDTQLQIKSNENKSAISKQLDNYVDDESFNRAIEEIKHSKELDNTGLFNRVMKLLQDIKKDSTVAIGSKEWVDKTEALVSTYFNSNNKEVLNVDDESFIENWIDHITVVDRPLNDRRQFDPLSSQVRAESSEGDVTFDSFFSFLLKAKSVDELTQLLNLYKSRLTNLKVPDAEKYLETTELLQQIIASLPDNYNFNTEIETLSESTTELPSDSNTFDRKDNSDYSYYSNNKYRRVGNKRDRRVEIEKEIIPDQFGANFIGALIHTQDLNKFKNLLLKHNIEDKRFNQKLDISELNKALYDSSGNVVKEKFKSREKLVTRSEYKLPGNATFGSIMGNIYNKDTGLNIAGLTGMFLTNGGNINLNKYLRFTAEKITDTLYKLQETGTNALNSIGKLPNGKRIFSGLGDVASQAFTRYTGISTNKRRMLEETLGMLVYLRDQFERNNQVNRDRLPGTGLLSQSLISTGTKGLGNKLIGKIKASLGTGSTAIPTRNRPTKTNTEDIQVYKAGKDGNGTRKDRKETRRVIHNYLERQPAEPTIAFQENKRAFYDNNYFTESLLLGKSEDLKNGIINLSKRFKVPGIQTTLRELTGYDASYPVSSLEDFKKLLIESPYITTPGKFGSDKFGYKTQTLSSNSFWEIKLEPFVHKNMNGGFSYLPSIREINVKNLHDHGIYTGYNEWLPITNFELERAKLATKSLGIYEGEIVYPTGCEFLNELSITMINDSLKSWSGYWRTVMEVSTYNSEPHTADFYKDPYPLPTAIDHTAPLVALYKNITWRCQIYILSPQYSTLKKFDLLVVLKDYTESYVGEIDSPGGDVQLRFSIVGENPPEETPLISADTDTKKVDRENELRVSKGGGFTDGSGDSDDSTPKDKTTTTGEDGDKSEKTETDTDESKDETTTEDSQDPPPPPTKKPPEDSGTKNTRVTNTGNGYYARKVVQEEFAVERSVGYEVKTVTKYYMEWRPGDPSKDPEALMFFFDENGKISEIHTFEQMDELNKSIKTWGDDKFNGWITGYTDVYNGEKVNKDNVDYYNYWLGDNSKNAFIPGLIDFTVSDDQGNRNEELVSQTVGIVGNVEDNPVVRNPKEGSLM
jgi:hypothetical protein